MIDLSNKGAKLMTLCDIEGYDSLDDLLEDCATDAVCPAICMNMDCNYTTEMEPDQTKGYCDECKANTMVSALILAGVI